MAYRDRVQKSLSAAEYRILKCLSTPQKIQDYLDRLPINFEHKKETYMSPRRVLREQRAHCVEGALLAAAALALHGEKPLLMDLRSAPHDVDHVVALFKMNGYWGAISKTNHPVLRYRDPIYPEVRSLALSYAHEYFMDSGEKTLREYSAPFDLSRYNPEAWITAEEELDELVDDLDASRHFPLVPKKNRKELRRASRFEVKATGRTEWKKR